ncbi:MAG: trehalose/maltose transport system permease protein [Acidimicrobiaceae bacterium]|jgi:multiple sugar transport system permease protein|nr:trehalose/maltose transport system permease protein [Acidimicrobiaceae bacterium]MDQ1419008.1 trehalose/maltose transport system permease protein [Acidimicrobiaceae bacterium]MDQ1439918.1 trehalose/maltose transport system permease protein [Acidimicrobiaceae bacterium]
MTGSATATRPKQRRQRSISVGGAILIVVYTMLPIAWILSLSLKSPGDLTNKKFLPSHWTLANYRTVFKTSLFTDALRNSIGISLIATVIGVVVATFAAYAIARLDFPGKRVILSLALAIAIFPQVALLGSLFSMWRAVKLYDTWPGLIIPYVSFTLPLSIWVLSAFFREIPWEMEQAAQVDGATAWQAFTKAIVPLAAPGVFTTAIIAFFAAWQDFAFAITLTSTNRARTVPAALAFFTGASQFQQPTTAIAAGAIVVTVPIIILVLVFQRRIVAGLTAGAVKG